VRRRLLLAAVLAAVALAALFLVLRRGLQGPEPGSGAPGTVGAADLYFADAEGRRLVIERRAISPGTAEETARAVAEELIAGPRDPALVPTLPPTAALLEFFQRGDTAYLDFSLPLATDHPGGSWGEALTVYSIVNSIAANVPGVARVQILLDGREGETLAGHIVLDRPLAPQMRLLDGDF
jgi:germination protein M